MWAPGYVDSSSILWKVAKLHFLFTIKILSFASICKTRGTGANTRKTTTESISQPSRYIAMHCMSWDYILQNILFCEHLNCQHRNLKVEKYLEQRLFDEYRRIQVVVNCRTQFFTKKRIVLPIIVATMVGDRWRDLGHWLLNRAPPAWTQVISHQSSSQFPRTRIRRCFFTTFSNHTPGTAGRADKYVELST